MFCKRVRIALLVCTVVAAATLVARADDKAPEKKAEPLPNPTPAAPMPPPAADGCGCCAPQYKTVCVTEWVPEHYQATRTVYKNECYQEHYTAYRTECVPETRTHTYTVMHRETYEVDETRCVMVCTPCQEERTVYKKHVTCVPVTTMTCKTVDHGHWECKEVECGPTVGERLKGLFARHHNDSCGCESSCGCATSCCEAACPRTKTVKVWVACKETVQVPCTHMERHVECVAEKCMVTVNKMVPTQQTVKVCKTRCVPECKTETCTVMVKKCVPYDAVRTCTKCVPVCETYTACRMVAHTVEKQVACGCESSCCYETHSRLSAFRGLFHRSSSETGCGCESGCGCH